MQDAITIVIVIGLVAWLVSNTRQQMRDRIKVADLLTAEQKIRLERFAQVQREVTGNARFIGGVSARVDELDRSLDKKLADEVDQRKLDDGYIDCRAEALSLRLDELQAAMLKVGRIVIELKPSQRKRIEKVIGHEAPVIVETGTVTTTEAVPSS